jgi:5-dehydro-2-deoxygluconokinase
VALHAGSEPRLADELGADAVTGALTLGRVIVDLYAAELHRPLAEVESFRKYLGGSAGNTAVGLARLGAPVGLISRVGDDDFGRFLLAELEREGVATAMVGTDPLHPTGLAFAAIFPPDDSKVLFYRKPCADANLAPEDLDLDRLGSARLLCVAGTALAVSPGREAALLALRAHREAGGINVIDVDWRPQFWPGEQVARLYYGLAVGLCDVVLANEPELAFAGGDPDPDRAAAALLALGPAQVVAKRGGAGAWLYTRDGVERMAGHAIAVVNTLGAGDGFGAAYCFGLLEGWEPARCLAFANAAGAIVVSRHSCSQAMPTRNEVEALLRR